MRLKRGHIGLGSAALGMLLCTAADAESMLDEVRKVLPRQNALTIQVGLATPAAAVELGKGSHVAHAIEPDAARVEQATAKLLRAGLTGRTWIENGVVNPLPYVDSLANAVFVDDWNRMAALGLKGIDVVRVPKLSLPSDPPSRSVTTKLSVSIVGARLSDT